MLKRSISKDALGEGPRIEEMRDVSSQSEQAVYCTGAATSQAGTDRVCLAIRPGRLQKPREELDDAHPWTRKRGEACRAKTETKRAPEARQHRLSRRRVIPGDVHTREGQDGQVGSDACSPPHQDHGGQDGDPSINAVVVQEGCECGDAGNDPGVE